MNKEQFLITGLIEELSEVIKELTQCVMFGCDKIPSDKTSSNFERAQSEMEDVLAVMYLLDEQVDRDIWPKDACFDMMPPSSVLKANRLRSKLEKFTREVAQ